MADLSPEQIQALADRRFGRPSVIAPDGTMEYGDDSFWVHVVGPYAGFVFDVATKRRVPIDEYEPQPSPVKKVPDQIGVEAPSQPHPALKPSPMAAPEGEAVNLLPDAERHGSDADPDAENVVSFASAKAKGKRKTDAKPAGAPKKLKSEEKETQGRPLVLPEPEAWGEVVDGKTLLDDLVKVILTYLVMPEEAAQAMALWVLHVHAFDAAEHTPRLLFTSPVKRCGKSTALRVLADLVPRPLDLVSVTAAALFRTIEKMSPCALIDEFDASGHGNEEIRALVNAGHIRGGTIVRCVGESYEPRAFAVSAPLAIAAIGRVHGTIEDRSVMIAMRRRKTAEKVERFRAGRPSLHVLGRQAARWAADHLTRLKHADPSIPAGLNDRAADNWRPLLAIADRAGGDWPERARNAASVLCGLGDELEAAELGVQLLIDIKAVFDDRKVDRLASADLVDALIGDETMPWGEIERGRALTARGLASRLRRFKIKPKNIRVGVTVSKGYERDDFTEAWDRYCR